MSLLYFFKNKSECSHPDITPENSGKYCPNCGKRVIIEWYLIRCSCCNTKRYGALVNGSIVPYDKFCFNCGESEYYTEKLSKVSFYDIDYAVIIKKVDNTTQSFIEKTQIWVEAEKKNVCRALLPKLSH